MLFSRNAFFSPALIEHLPIVEGEGERILINKARMATWSLMEAPPGIMGMFPFCLTMVSNVW